MEVMISCESVLSFRLGILGILELESPGWATGAFIFSAISITQSQMYLSSKSGGGGSRGIKSKCFRNNWKVSTSEIEALCYQAHKVNLSLFSCNLSTLVRHDDAYQHLGG